jgi:hypothetical protein
MDNSDSEEEKQQHSPLKRFHTDLGQHSQNSPDSEDGFRSDNRTTTYPSSRKLSQSSFAEEEFKLETLTLPVIDTEEREFGSSFRLK